MTLPDPTTHSGREALRLLLAKPESALLVTDYDGTLAPIVLDPARAYAAPGALEALSSLATRLRTVAVLTGRPVDELLRLSDLHGVPGLLVLGRYGLERWSGGAVPGLVGPPEIDVARDVLDALISGEEGVTLEDKGTALAIHTRGAPEPQDTFERLRPAVAAAASAGGLVLEPGRLVLEVRVPGPDKGAAIDELVREVAPEVAVFLGDDAGDLPAFAALERLRSAGDVRALLVASSSVEEPRVALRADLVLAGPAAVVAFLGSLADALG
jgi:trehalose 6-phosphate phosphatase